MGLGRVNTEPTALAAGTAGLHPLKSPDPWESPFLETPPFPPSPRPPKRRRRTAPALGPSAVYPHGRSIRTETQHTRPLLVGRVCVYFEPTALSVGTADPVELGADGGDGDLDEYCQE